MREQVEISVKYEGYIRRQLSQVEEFEKLEQHALPPDRGLHRYPGSAPGGPGKAQCCAPA
ncbi:MAG: hypothetical protein ACLUNQ_08210 [Oscillospiraceae bacterium]